uniref:CCHC-type domain-containing protein n=1 Tax=Parascaris univalens TaxID=6257 RepID=A0A915B870_PARUN
MRTATIGKPTHEGRQVQKQVGRREQRNLGGVKPEESLHHTSALPAVAKRQIKGKGRRHDLTRQVCAFCSEPHWADSCPRFTTLKERFDRARQLRLCFKCLREGHNQNDCTRNVSCYHCKRKGHPTALCKTWHRSQQGKEENPVGETHTQTIRTVAAIATPEQQERDKTVLLLSTFVEVRGDAPHTKTIKVPVLFDVGSERSFITEEIVQQLGIEVTHKEPLIVDGFGGTHVTHCTSARVKLKMKRTDGRFFTMFANSVPRLVSEIAIAKLTEKTLRRIRSTRSITLPTVTLKPQILVGADYFHEIFRGSASTKLPSGFHLIRTCLGDMISGQGRSVRHGTPSKIKPANRCCCNVASAKDELEKFWSLELVGVSDPPLQTDDELAMKRFNESITFKDGRYYCSWPWKEDGGKLDSNFGLCMGRLKTSLKHLQKDPELLRAYEKTFDEQLKTGIIEDVTNTPPEGPMYYMPHQAVVRPGKATTKIRIVYDASSKTRKEGHSLNDVLLRGPLLLTKLCGVLLRVRLAPILITADVEKAFLQIGLHHDQRDAVRFIWVKDVTAPVSSTNLRVFRFTRVPFGVISSPFLLNATIQYHLKRKTTEIREEIQDNIYVDNVFLTAHQIPAAIEKGQEAKRVFEEADMNLREFRSNNREVLSALNEDSDSVQQSATLLGIVWDHQEDTMVFNTKCHNWPATKRQFLAYTAEFYDPSGLFTPATLPLKLFLQHLWKKEYDWDQPFDNTDCQTAAALLERFQG